MPGSRYDQDVGSPTNQRFVQVTSTRQKITIRGVHYKTIEFYNADTTNVIYFGDSGVTAGAPPTGTGMPFFPGDFRYFKGAYNAFEIWMVCPVGQSAYISIMEYP